MIQLLIALVLGAVLGLEREINDKPAGLRSIIIVTLIGAILSLLTVEYLARGWHFDSSRIVAYAIASLGFLGSGVILQKKDGVEGITTAALLLFSLIIGILAGLSMYRLAIISTVIIFLVLQIKYIEVKIKDYLKKRKNDKKT